MTYDEFSAWHRNDAGLAAAEVALAVEAAVLNTGAIDAVCSTPLKGPYK